MKIYLQVSLKHSGSLFMYAGHVGGAYAKNSYGNMYVCDSIFCSLFFPSWSIISTKTCKSNMEKKQTKGGRDYRKDKFASDLWEGVKFVGLFGSLIWYSIFVEAGNVLALTSLFLNSHTKNMYYGLMDTIVVGQSLFIVIIYILLPIDPLLFTFS